MGVSGVPLHHDHAQIKQILKKNHGIMTRAARELNMHVRYLYTVLDANPELKEFRDNIRVDYEESMLDEAEEVLRYSLSVSAEDLPNSLKGMMYLLNTKGAKRGYLPAEVAAAKEEANRSKELDLSLADLQEFAEWRAERKARRSVSPQSLAQPAEEPCIYPQADQSPS